MSSHPMLATLNAGVPFARFVGVEVLALSPDGAAAVLPERPELLNHIASQHAGALFTVAEAASGAAVIGALGELAAQSTPLVRSASIFYLKVARGPVRAAAALAEPAGDIRARFADHGKADFTVTVVLMDASDMQVATFHAEWSLRAAARG